MKILLLGSGELGKEFAIAAQRIGQTVIAVDSYENAPAMQVAHDFEVINMLDGDALDKIVAKHKPDFIVPEIEAIRTERFYDYEKQGITVVPSAKAANFTMNRKAIRDLASKELGLKIIPIGASGYKAKELFDRVMVDFDQYYPNATTQFREAFIKLDEVVEEPIHLLSKIQNVIKLI